jgi:hypothetical protein
VAAALAVLDENPELFGVSSGTLETVGVRRLPLARIGSSDKVAVLFRQVVAGVPVHGASVSILFDAERGAIVALDSSCVRHAERVRLSPATSPADAVATAFVAFEEALGTAAVRVLDVDLAIVGASVRFGPKSPLRDRGPALAWIVALDCAGSLGSEGIPVGAKVFVSAEGDGAVFSVESTVRSSGLPVLGEVSGFVNLGPEPNDFLNQELAPLSTLWVRDSGAAGPILGLTDPWGAFVVDPGIPVLLFVELRGPYVDVNHIAGPDASFTAPAVPGGFASFLFNPLLAEWTTAEVAAAHWVDAFRTYVRTVDPSDPSMDFQVVANVNHPGWCNGFFDGTSINFDAAGTGCSNTAYRSVLHHEEGHWANDVYNGGATPAFHEGAADAWAYYISDDPCMAFDLYGIGTSCLRNGTQTTILKCPGFSDEYCHGGEAHTEGEVLGSALWKVRANLEASRGGPAGAAAANALFLAWFQAFDDSVIYDTIADHWIALDDDDGDLSNGTPHFAEIDGGFQQQGFPGVKIPDLLFGGVAGPAHNAGVGDFESQDVTATVSSLQGSVVAAEILYSTDDGQSWTSTPMSPTGNPDEWIGTIPGFASPESIRWFVQAFGSAGGVPTTDPPYAPIDSRLYHAGVVTSLASYDFESPSDEGWTHAALAGGAAGDPWERGDPSGSAAWSDPTTGAASGGACWGTDLSLLGTDGLYEPNASGELRSPWFDFTTSSRVRLQYRRSLAVEKGIYDRAEVLVNGVPVFANSLAADTIDFAWTLVDLDVTAVAAGNPSVQFAWRITADPGVEYGGWNVDDVEIVRVDPNSPGGSFTAYGAGCEGTGGVVPVIGGSGSPTPGGAVSFDVSQGLPNGLGAVFLSLLPGSYALSGGCVVLVGLLGTVAVPIGLDGQGTGALPLTIPPGVPPGLHLYGQYLGLDPGSLNGVYSASHGVDMAVY